MADPLGTEILDNAGKPIMVDRDGVRMRQHNLKDLIAADLHQAGKSAATNQATTAGVTGLRFRQLVPPGA